MPAVLAWGVMACLAAVPSDASAADNAGSDRVWQWQRGGSFRALDFPSASVGWFGGELLVQGVKNQDGSWSWQQVARELTDERSITALSFSDEQHGCALGSDNTFLYTAQRGLRWEVRSLPAGVSELNAVSMTGPDTIYAVGRSSDAAPKGVVLRSGNRGIDWSLLSTTVNEAWQQPTTTRKEPRSGTPLMVAGAGIDRALCRPTGQATSRLRTSRPPGPSATCWTSTTPE